LVRRRRHFASAALALVLGLAAPLAAARAQPADFPARPVRIVVTFPPGGTTDILAREVGQRLQQVWGQPAAVENRPGAGGNIGADVVAKSAPDGHTMLLGNSGTHAINQSLYERLPFDPIRDFAPVTLLASVPNIFLLHPSVPATTMREYVALVRSDPARRVFASSGNGTTQHLTVKLLRAREGGLEMTHIPCRGASPGVADLLGGQVPMMAPSLPSSGIAEHVRAGRLRALAVTGPERAATLPDVPTMAEAGYPDFVVTTWYGLLVPAATPPAVVARIHADTVRLLEQPDLRRRLADQGMDAVTSRSPAEFAAFIAAETTRWAQVVRASGARMD
jgi:tripartite-type tricarboxylate transporter receptor subunit TctC